MNNQQNSVQPVAAVRAAFEESIAVKTRFIADHCASVVAVATAIADSIRTGNKIMFCGNGGSAADAQHLAAELLVRFRPTVNRKPLPALALSLDPSSITACVNDYSFDSYYARSVAAFGKPGDVLVGISTSGKSPNVIQALRTARALKIRAIGFLGGEGRPAIDECDLAIVVPSTVTARIQECHITAGHIVMQLVEDSLLESGFMTLENSTQP